MGRPGQFCRDVPSHTMTSLFGQVSFSFVNMWVCAVENGLLGAARAWSAAGLLGLHD